MFLIGLKQQLEDAQRELLVATTSGAAKRIVESRQAMVDLLIPMQQRAFDEWLVLTDTLKEAKHRAMGIQPKGSPRDTVARRLFGPKWDDMPLPPAVAPPAMAQEAPRRRLNLRAKSAKKATK